MVQFIPVLLLTSSNAYININKALRKGFAARYKCTILVFYELHETMESAIIREKQLKGGSRLDKLKLTENSNPEWKD